MAQVKSESFGSDPRDLLIDHLAWWLHLFLLQDVLLGFFLKPEKTWGKMIPDLTNLIELSKIISNGWRNH